MSDIYEELKAVSLLHPRVASADAVPNADVVGTGVDVESFTGDALAVLDIGAGSDGSCFLHVSIQGSTDGSTYPDTLLSFGSITGNVASNRFAAGNLDLTEYVSVRVVASITGTGSPSMTFGVSLLGNYSTHKSGLNSANPA